MIERARARGERRQVDQKGQERGGEKQQGQRRGRGRNEETERRSEAGARREVMQIVAHGPPTHAPFPDAAAPISCRGSPVRRNTPVYNQSNFHNHVAHHLLTIYAFNASSEVIEKQYKRNASHQRPQGPLEQSIVNDMQEPEKFKTYLGAGEYYHDFLEFFRKEIDQRGWQNTLNKFVFSEDERAEDMLVRMFGGFLHPIIHLGFGIEFQQPAIIAEALAMAAVHSNWMAPLFQGAEKAANEHPLREQKTIVQLLDDIRADKMLSNAARWSDDNKVRDGILTREPDRMISYAAQYAIKEPAMLEEKNAEMTNAVVYYTGAAQNPAKTIKFDFYYMHCTNCSIFFSAFMKAPWLSDRNKIRLMEWKVRNDLTMYASRRSPPLLLDEIINYKPREPSSWAQIITRVSEHEDDGHAAKLVRALAHGQNICKPYEDKNGFPIKNDMWLQLGHMAIDSVTDSNPSWVRSCGFEEAWENIKPRAQL